MSNLWLWCIVVFFAGYTINITYITVFYHRALAHQSIVLPKILRKFVVFTGPWLTGIDPKAWACMHRLHHRYSDTKKDPHSPHHKGFFGIALAQLESYNRVLKGLLTKKDFYTDIVSDLDFPIGWANRKGLWKIPYLVQLFIAGILAFASHPLLGIAYYIGIMSHPFQGWLVNSVAHYFGYRNFRTTDKSKNSTIVALLVAGEGYQNNHHRFPESPKFSMRWWEIDWGWGICVCLRTLGLVKIRPN